MTSSVAAFRIEIENARPLCKEKDDDDDEERADDECAADGDDLIRAWGGDRAGLIFGGANAEKIDA